MFSNAAQEINNAAERVAGANASDLRDAANQAGRKVRRLLDNAGYELEGVQKNVAGRIRRRPFQAALLALGAGLAIGALLRR